MLETFVSNLLFKLQNIIYSSLQGMETPVLFANEILLILCHCKY